MLSVKEKLISFSNPKRPVILPVRASEMPGVNLIIEPVWMGENYYLPASVILPRIGKIGDPNIIPLNDHRAFVGIRTPLPGYVRTEKDLAQFLGTQAAMELVWETIDKVNESKYPHKSGFSRELATVQDHTVTPSIIRAAGMTDILGYAMEMMKPIASERFKGHMVYQLWPGIYYLPDVKAEGYYGFYAMYTPAHRSKIANVLNDIHMKGQASQYAAFPDVEEERLDKSDIGNMASYAMEYTNVFTFLAKTDISMDPLFAEEDIIPHNNEANQ